MGDQNGMSATPWRKKNDNGYYSLGFGNLNCLECKKRVFRALFAGVVARHKIPLIVSLNSPIFHKIDLKSSKNTLSIWICKELMKAIKKYFFITVFVPECHKI